MIRAEYKNKYMTLEVSGSVTDITIELDNLLHHFIETQPDIVNGCIIHEEENLCKSFKKCDMEKVATIDLLLNSEITIEKGVDN